MEKPNIWAELKRKDYEKAIEEEKANAKSEFQKKYELLEKGLQSQKFIESLNKSLFKSPEYQKINNADNNQYESNN